MSQAMSGDQFESEVRRVARALWPSAEFGGAEMIEFDFDGRRHEVDGVFETEDVVHMVEATMQRTKLKAEQDGEKLAGFLRKQRSRGKLAKAWFVTLHDPTADQRAALRAKDPSIDAVSFEQFRMKLVNAAEYLHLRSLADWGSAANPGDGSSTSLPPYVPLQISTLVGGRVQPATGARRGALVAGDIVSLIDDGQRISLVGDYGAGKSMTVREIHQQLEQRYRKKQTARFPITLNLRRHYGQRSPWEALRRHAEIVGFEAPSSLVRAWRAGYVHILLDGFDEMAAQGWTGNVDILRENRRAATELIRNFSNMSASGTGVLVSGRRHYFNSLQELSAALFDGRPHSVLELNDFTKDQAQEFVKSFQEWDYDLPQWVPARPLLLGYLVVHNLLATLDDGARDVAPQLGWDQLLMKVCEREAFIKPGMDGAAVRQIVERLASIARSTPQGVGPLHPTDIVNAFTSVRRQPPVDEDMTLLQRLPGLGGVENQEDGTRKFVDIDLASTAQAGDIRRFIEEPYRGLEQSVAPEQWMESMDQLGVNVAASQLAASITSGQLRNALSQAVQSGRDVLAADIARIAMAREVDLTGSRGVIAEVIVPQLIVEGETDFSGLSFSQCIFKELSIEGDDDGVNLPQFSQCSFEAVWGRLGEKDMPPAVFHDCTFAEFPDGADVNAAVLSASSLPRGTRVVMALLRKLYLQHGSGRRASGLLRGMSQADQQLVEPALRLLKREGLAVPTKMGGGSLVWLPDRSAGPRVRAFLSSPRLGDDPLVVESKTL